MDVEVLGQVFTPPEIVDEMLALKKNHGRTLEPSCGDGAFSRKLDNCVSVELDPKVCPEYALCMNFFDYPKDEKFDTVIGNPPYVRFSKIGENTKSKLDMTLFDKRTNLCLFFIEKCVKHLKEHGELIFIVPREVLKATSARKLNSYLYENGTITDIRETGDEKIFDGASPNCIIFRYEKDNFTRKTTDGRIFTVSNGQILFLNEKTKRTLKDITDIKVGAVSGLDRIYANNIHGNMDFVCSTTRKDGKTRRMIYNEKSPYLEQFHDELINRKIKHFTEDNWWKWGRDFPQNDKPRVYVNCKTRVENPFFTNPCNNFDGSVLAIFPKDETIDIQGFINKLNALDWETLGFKCDGRYIFAQKALEDVPIPDDF